MGLQDLLTAVKENLVNQEVGLKAGMRLPGYNKEESQQAIASTTELVAKAESLIEQGISLSTTNRQQLVDLLDMVNSLEASLEGSTNPALTAQLCHQLKVTQDGDQFDSHLTPTRDMNLQTILESLGDKVDIDYIKKHFPVDLEKPLEAKTISIFNQPGTESENHQFIKDKGLELEGTEGTLLATGALLYGKELDGSEELTSAEKNLLELFKKKFVRYGSRSAGVNVDVDGVLRAGDCYLSDHTEGLPCGVAPESK